MGIEVTTFIAVKLFVSMKWDFCKGQGCEALPVEVSSPHTNYITVESRSSWTNDFPIQDCTLGLNSISGICTWQIRCSSICFNNEVLAQSVWISVTAALYRQTLKNFNGANHDSRSMRLELNYKRKALTRLGREEKRWQIPCIKTATIIKSNYSSDILGDFYIFLVILLDKWDWIVIQTQKNSRVGQWSNNLFISLL